jgi:hypothetical protein
MDNMQNANPSGPAVDTPADGSEAQTSQESQQQDLDYRKIKHKVKVDNQELEIPYDQLLADWQLGKVSRKRMEEAARIREETFSFFDELKSGKVNLLEDYVPQDKLVEYAYDLLKRRVEYEEMPEERKELELLKKEINKYKQKEEQEKTQLTQRQMQEEKAKAEEWLDNKLSSMITNLRNKYGNIVGTGIANEIARGLEAYELSLEDGDDSEPDIEAISDRVWKRWQKTTFDYIRNLPVDEITKNVLTKDHLKAIRKSDLEEALSSLPTHRRTPNQDVSSKKGSGDDHLTLDEKWEKKFGKF